ncbi:MAG: metallophosphoesterase family protein [Candidatus Bathyarchaeota archaeon]|nr:metallophosphoesterase family protein [Candidatus Bathyarchaeota archaeon]
MKKRSIWRALFILFAVLTLTLAMMPSLSTVHASLEQSFLATELLGRPTDSSIMVSVVPNANGQVYFKYGLQSGVYTTQTGIVTLVSGIPSEVLIDGLTPNTKYYYRMVYRVNDDTWAEGEEHTFQTQRSTGSTFSFTITADSHVNIAGLGSASVWEQTMTNVANNHPDFEVDLGDTFAMDYVTTQSEADQAYLYQRQFFGIVGHSAPIFLAVGNHEQQEAWHLDDFGGNVAASQPVLGANAQNRYFLNPAPDEFYSGNSEPYPSLMGDHLRRDYYAWNWGDALFVVIDPYWYTTTKPFLGNQGGGENSDAGSNNRWDWTLGLQQFLWLNQTLQSSSAKYKFVFAHHQTGGADNYGGRGGAVPAHLVEWGGYNIGGALWGWNINRPVAQWGNKPIHQIMIDTHVTAFFHGHDHQYAYEVRDGIVYQSLPAGGFSGNGFNSYSVGTYTLKVLPSPGHLRVTVSPSKVTVDYVNSAPGQANNGQVIYSYVISDASSLSPTPSPTPTYTSPPTNPTQQPTDKPTTKPTPTLPNPTQTPTIPEITVFPIWLGVAVGIFSLVVSVMKKRNQPLNRY